MNTSDLNSFFEDPTSIRKLVQQGLQSEVVAGSLSEDEVKRLMEEPEKKKVQPKAAAPDGSFVLRGEGPSGERARAVVQPVASLPPVVQSKEEISMTSDREGIRDVKDHHSEADFRGGDPVADGGDIGEITPSVARSLDEGNPTAISELRAYCEDQFRSLFQILTPLTVRVEQLERRTSASIPTTVAMGRKVQAESPPPTRHSRVLSGTGVKELRIPKVLNQEIIASFARSNPTYPTLKVVREAKLRTLLSLLGLEFRPVEVRPSEWTGEGLYTLLSAEYQV